MAISRFTQSPSANLTAFKAWLDSHKAGTFLENVEITLTTTTSTNDTITFSDETMSIQYIASAKGSYGGENTCITCTVNSTGYTRDVKTNSGSNSDVRFAGAILCNTGLIFNIYGYTNRAYKYASGIAIATDEKNNLAFLCSATNIPANSGDVADEYTSWVAITSSSHESAVIPAIPAFGMNQTSFAPIVALGDDDARLPHAFAAISTELTERGIERLEIDGSDYITNGVWYIKDGE